MPLHISRAYATAVRMFSSSKNSGIFCLNNRMASSRSGQDQSITGICDAMLMSMFVCCSEFCKCQFHIAKITLAACSDSCQCQEKGLWIETPGMSIVCALHGRERLLSVYSGVLSRSSDDYGSRPSAIANRRRIHRSPTDTYSARFFNYLIWWVRIKV